MQKKNLSSQPLFFPEQGDTICALSTPPGEGALSLIRMSGPASFKIARKLCPFLPAKIQSHRLYFGPIQHPKNQKPLDSGLVSCFQKGRSFTGEESVEFNCHGGQFISQSLLSALTGAGARIAKKGEFSYRAFMNGKMDLIQAESVLALIKSRSQVSQTQALSALKGSLSQRLTILEQKLLRLLSHIEASLDFSEEDISPFPAEEQKKWLKEIKAEVIHLLRGFEQGLINHEGFSILLLGAPNAGKSSLFNHLLEEDKAIVTPLPGTTRDILSASLLWQGREFTLKDSAGFRPHPDPVEKEGIKKAKAEIDKASLVLFLVESHLPLKKESFLGLKELDGQKTVICFSKADLLSDKEQRNKLLDQSKAFFHQHCESLWLSAHTGEGVAQLKALCFNRSEKTQGEDFLSTPRQGQALKNISRFLHKAEKVLKEKGSLDLVAFELREGLSHLQQLTGRQYNEEVISGIFKEFCLGK